ncbi:MAG TPA: hypothetical protein VGF69_00040 [Thermoanaerobaculia bacterium]|jgi:hypothetical protein
MLLLTIDATIVCTHELGHVKTIATQSLVFVEGRPLEVDDDPEGRTIGGCPNTGPAIKPCTLTLAVRQGYSGLLRIDGRRVCLDTVIGFTDGTPPGAVDYKVRNAGQAFVSEKSR